MKGPGIRERRRHRVVTTFEYASTLEYVILRRAVPGARRAPIRDRRNIAFELTTQLLSAKRLQQSAPEDAVTQNCFNVFHIPPPSVLESAAMTEMRRWVIA